MLNVAARASWWQWSTCLKRSTRADFDIWDDKETHTLRSSVRHFKIVVSAQTWCVLVLTSICGATFSPVGLGPNPSTRLLLSWVYSMSLCALLLSTVHSLKKANSSFIGAGTPPYLKINCKATWERCKTFEEAVVITWLVTAVRKVKQSLHLNQRMTAE